MEELWTKMGNIHTPVEKIAHLIIFDLPMADSCHSALHTLHIFYAESSLSPAGNECVYHHFTKMSTNPQPVDNFPCGMTNPGKIRPFG